METTAKTTITIEAMIKAPIEKVWSYWTSPEHITKWNQASADWHTPFAENDLREGGMFKSTMAARDGSTQFDFEGVYSAVKEHALIEYTMLDGRKVKITFSPKGDSVEVVESFEAENTFPAEVQREGWQSILNSFKAYTEGN